MNATRFAHGLLFLAAAFQAVPATSIVYVMPTDESMVDRSPIIVFGEVLSVQPGPYGGFPTTDYLFRVEEVLKGFVAGSGIMVRQPGGVAADGTIASVPGLPMLAEGNRVLLFLRPEEEGAHRVVEYGLGMFFETRIGDLAFLLRERSLQGEVVLPDGPGAAERVRIRGYRDAAAFRRWVADRAAGFERPSDFLAAELPDGPVAVASPSRLLTYDCDGETLPVRWRNFDRGESVGFQVQSSGQRGLAGGGDSQLLAAMRLWNADSESNVDLQRTETVADAPPLKTRDHVNSITFEDPHREIGGSLEDGSGVTTLAKIFWWPSCTEVGEGERRFWEIAEVGITTRRGYFTRLEEWGDDAERRFQGSMAHELGHALGIDHPCDDDPDDERFEEGCDQDHDHYRAVMWFRNHEDRHATELHSYDQAAVRALYPEVPDLAVEDPRTTKSSVAAGGSIRFAATVRNRGSKRSGATTLRIYQSRDREITTSDTPVGSVTVRALAPSEAKRYSKGLRVPTWPLGTYYYGACVYAVSYCQKLWIR